MARATSQAFHPTGLLGAGLAWILVGLAPGCSLILGATPSFREIDDSGPIDMDAAVPLQDAAMDAVADGADANLVDAASDSGRCSDASDCDDGDPCTLDRCSFGVCTGGPIPRCVDHVGAGLIHTCARRVNGDVHCWGGNVFGQLGDGSMEPRSMPPGDPVARRTLDLAVGGFHNLARTMDDSVLAWGLNADGQLGDGTIDNRLAPIAVMGLADAAQVSADVTHSCALRTGGGPVCWGDGGALGNGEADDRPAPVAVMELSDAIEVQTAWGFTCALTAAAGVRCWGSNEFLQLGDEGGSRLAPGPPLDIAEPIERLAVGTAHLHSCAVARSGAALCWGGNGAGQLGDGTTMTERSTALPVVGLTDVAEVATGNAHSCARRRSGAVLCWGSNSDGQLGDGTGVDSPLPIAVEGLTDAIQITASGAHSCARRRTGAVVCWGRNSDGQLGDGTTESRLAPVDVVGL